MSPPASAFGPFDGRVWLNAAHQGPLPAAAATAGRAALDRKRRPVLMSDESFHSVPESLRRSLAALIGARPEEIALGDSASHGLHVVAGGLDLPPGSEVIVVAGDFPATHLPFRGLEDRGVRVTSLPRPLLPDSLRGALGPATRAVCFDAVNSFDGGLAPVRDLAAVCRDADVPVIVNATQALGVLPVSVAEWGADALVSCGFKWLCGPYGTGFLWVSERLLPRLRCERRYWLKAYRGGAISPGGVDAGVVEGASRFDVFGTANFTVFEPWNVSVDLIRSVGIDRIAEHVASLIERLTAGVAGLPYRVVAPAGRVPAPRSGIVSLTHEDPDRNRACYEQLRAAGIDIALRDGNLRFSPHLYNLPEDLDRALDALAAA